MKCVIKNVDDEAFLEYLIKKIRDYSLMHLNIKLLNSCKEYLIEVYPELKNINLYRFLQVSFQNLIYKKYGNDYVIEFNPRKTYCGIKLDDICNLINYGTLDNKPYPIYSLSFNYIITNLKQIKIVYDRGM